MANLVYNIAKRDYDPTSLAAATVKMLLIEGSGASDPDLTTVAAVLSARAELVCTGYTAGPGSASRQTSAITAAVDNTNDRATATATLETFTALSGGDVIRAYLLYVHISGTDDALNIPLAWIDTATGLPLTTNGSNVEVGSVVLRWT